MRLSEHAAGAIRYESEAAAYEAGKRFLRTAAGRRLDDCDMVARKTHGAVILRFETPASEGPVRVMGYLAKP